jgi:AcrR family transcriptional regulator
MSIDSDMPVSAKRQKLIDTALDLFCRRGFHVTGIDTILAESGVAKMTLYNHFKSKDELIHAALEMGDRVWREWFVGAVERRAGSPTQRLLALFDATDEWISGKDFAGCAFVRASGEFPNQDDPIHKLAIEHYRMVRSYVRGLAAAAGAAQPDALADALCLLLRGAVATAQVCGAHGVVAQARPAAEVLIEHAIKSGRVGSA